MNLYGWIIYSLIHLLVLVLSCLFSVRCMVLGLSCLFCVQCIANGSKQTALSESLFYYNEICYSVAGLLKQTLAKPEPCIRHFCFYRSDNRRGQESLRRLWRGPRTPPFQKRSISNSSLAFLSIAVMHTNNILLLSKQTFSVI